MGWVKGWLGFGSYIPGFGSGVKSDVTKLAGNNPDLPSSPPFHQFASLNENLCVRYDFSGH